MKKREAGRDIFVVYDVGGAGRVVGVFGSQNRADQIVDVNPGYYRSTRCRIDEVTDAAFDWLKSLEQRERLEKLRSLRSESA